MALESPGTACHRWVDSYYAVLELANGSAESSAHRGTSQTNPREAGERVDLKCSALHSLPLPGTRSGSHLLLLLLLLLLPSPLVRHPRMKRIAFRYIR